MPLFRIADIIVDMSPKYEETASWYEPYRIADNAEPQLTVTANDKEITYFVNKGVDITPPISENMVFCDKFNRSLIQFDGCYIHSSALKFDDKVYLFSAFSGVGKSTHTKKWCRLYPERAKVINDDKPSFRVIDGKCIVYGTPFAGGTDLQCNDKGELAAIVFLERCEENRLVKLSTPQAITELTQQMPKRKIPEIADKQLSLLSSILGKYPVYKLYCADNDEAVEVAFQIVEQD